MIDSEDKQRQFDSSIEVSDRQYTKRRRHKAINDARERVSEVVLDIEERRLSGQMEEWEARRATRRAVEMFVNEILWLLQTHPEGQGYLSKEQLGVMQLPRPAGADQGWFTSDVSDLATDFPYIQFTGLQSLLHAPETISGTWETTTTSPISGTDHSQEQVEQFIPREISMRAFQICSEFLGKADFGIDFDDERPLVKVTPEPAEETSPGVYPMSESELLKKNKKLTVSGANDQLILISASSRTPVSGTGKTTLATSLAKRLDTSDSGFDAAEQSTFDIGELAYDLLDNVERGSALIYDEAQGTPSNTGLNARRGMKQESIDGINGILANRDKNLTLIIVAQQMNMMDSNLYATIDSWLLIRKAVEDRNGPMATHYTIHTNDYDLGKPKPKTPTVEDITWDALPADDPDYRHMEKQKQEAKKRKTNGDGGDSKDPKKIRNERIKSLADSGATQDEIADAFDLEQGTISKVVNDKA